jgi:hypothetical protein
VTDSVVAMYPSPAGATERAAPGSWSRLVALNRRCGRSPTPRADRGRRLNAAAIAPIDRCYKPGRADQVTLGGSPAVRASSGRSRFFVGLRYRPEFEVLGATARHFAAVPTLDFACA